MAKPSVTETSRKLADALAPPVKKLVKQGELENILALRLQAETLKRELKKAEEELLKAELMILYAIEQGKPTEAGSLSCGVNEQAGRRTPKWKEEFARVAGPEAVEHVIDNTPPSAPTKKLVVMRSGQVVKGGE